MSPPGSATKQTGVRVHPRVQLCARVMLSTPRWVWSGQIENISRGGAFVGWGVSELPLLPGGELVRLTCRLPGGQRLSVCARVRWHRDDPAKPGVGVEFVELSRTDEMALAAYLATRLKDPAAEGIGVEVTEKFAVERDKDLLWLRICDVLRGEESQALAASVRERLASAVSERLLVFVDAVCLAPCPDESLGAFAMWMRSLHDAGSFCGVVVVKNRVASLQLKRMAREAGVADSLVCFDDEGEGMLFWNELRGQCRSGEETRLTT